MRKLIALLLILVTTPAFATFGAASAWDVRTTGVDTNGGAFDSGVGSPGTDESQGSSGTAITITLTGTTTGTGSPAFSSTTHGPGNFVHIASGSGCSTGWFEVLSQAAGVATFDHAMGVATNVCVGTIGGSLLTIGQGNTNSVSGNTIYIKAGTYTLTTVITLTQATMSLIGYNATHSDNGTKPLITTATNSTVLFATGGNGGTQLFQNLSLSNTASVRASGIWQPSPDGTTQWWVFNDDLFDGFGSAIDNGNGTPDDVNFVTVNRTEIKNSTTGFDAHSVNTGTFMFNINGSYFHGNVSDINIGSSSTTVSINDTIFANSTGSGTDVTANSPLVWVTNCTFVNNTSNTALGMNNSSLSFMLTNNVFYGNSKAISFSSSPNQVSASALSSHKNAFGNNAGANANWPGNVDDITLTANPFTASGSGDYSLNSTAGGGVLLKGAGYPGTFGTTSTSHLDVGAVQSAGSGGAATGNFGVSN